MAESSSTALEPRSEPLRACLEAAACLRLDELGLLGIEGADVPDLLQRVTSQEILGMDIGSGARAAVLSGKGKLLALFDLHRVGDTAFVAELPRAQVADLQSLIDRYVFAEDVQFSTPELSGLGVFGPAAQRFTHLATGASAQTDAGYTLVGDAAVRFWEAADASEARAAETGLPIGGMAEWNALRIERGAPLYGVDANDKTIPLEVGLDDACDPEKGCYPGQEIVARIRTYGHVNRLLCRLEIEAIDEIPSPGTTLFDEDIEAGRLTSCYRVPGTQSARALAMLPRALKEVGSELCVGSEDGPRAVVR